MDGKKYLGMVKLYMEGGKLCADYAHNATDLPTEREVLRHVRRFVNQRLDEVNEEIRKGIKEELER